MTSSESIYDGLPPSFFGLPEKFAEFRRTQAEALEYVVYESKKRFVGLGMPTGSGKSLFAPALARATGLKTIIHTATRGLQDQYAAMGVAGMVDVRGRSNYTCGQIFPNFFGGYTSYRSPTCEYGHQHECSLEHTRNCKYDAAVAAAVESDLIVDNYSYWLHSRKYNQGALQEAERPIELMVCDEATDVPDLISDFVSIRIAHADEELPIGPPARGEDSSQSGIMPEEPWLAWARERMIEALKQASRIAESYHTKAAAMQDDRYAYLQELIKTCERIPQLDSNWVWEVDKDGVRFQPIWPGALANSLWSGIPKIVLMSATLRPYTLGLLGLSEDSYDFREWPATWLPQYSPFYYQPSGVKLSWRSGPEDYAEIYKLADQWLDSRNDRRTIIHTGSYVRARMIQSMSRHAGRMIFNESGRDAAQKAEQFRRGPDNGILVGPSYTTGFDFPGRDCEFQIILKTPFPDTTSRVMKERCKNPDYRMHVVVNKLVQIVGRPRRFDTDRSETVIFDDGIKWAMGSPRSPWHGHAPGYFKCVAIGSGRVPPAPPRMQK